MKISRNDFRDSVDNAMGTNSQSFQTALPVLQSTRSISVVNRKADVASQSCVCCIIKFDINNVGLVI